MSRSQRYRISIGTIIRRVIIVLLFLTSATFILGYANGYLVDISSGRVERTGIINLTVKQMPVIVSVNGKEKEYTRTPINLSYLFPGDYTVDIKKDGYFTWSRVMQVPSGQVIINPFIKLFFATSAKDPASLEDVTFLINQEKPVLVTDLDVRDNEIWVKPIIRTYPFVVASDHFALIGRFSEPIASAVWNPDKTHVIYQRGLDIHVMDRDGSNDHVLLTLQNAGATEFAVTNNGQRLIYRDGTEHFVRYLL